jgi:hypothetical protein
MRVGRRRRGELARAPRVLELERAIEKKRPAATLVKTAAERVV